MSDGERCEAPRPILVDEHLDREPSGYVVIEEHPGTPDAWKAMGE